jgi:anaerobic ribonucleoside-triphosphate reductase activating protein
MKNLYEVNDMEVRLASPITFDSIVDGPGIRAVVWFQGCPHHCKGCHNPETWANEGGNIMTIDEVVSTIARNPLQTGVTLSGGDPLYQPEACLAMIKGLKASNNYSIWLYTGYTIEQLQEQNNDIINEILQNIDALVDGPFILEEKSLDLPFRGSRNQRIITLEKNA